MLCMFTVELGRQPWVSSSLEVAISFGSSLAWTSQICLDWLASELQFWLLFCLPQHCDYKESMHIPPHQPDIFMWFLRFKLQSSTLSRELPSQPTFMVPVIFPIVRRLGKELLAKTKQNKQQHPQSNSPRPREKMSNKTVIRCLIYSILTVPCIF